MYPKTIRCSCGVLRKPDEDLTLQISPVAAVIACPFSGPGTAGRLMACHYCGAVYWLSVENWVSGRPV